MSTAGAPSPEIVRIGRFIEEEAALLREFLTLLGEEEKLLLDAQSDALLALATTKTELYRRLQRIHDDRALLLGRMGLANSDASIRDLFTNVPRALARWDEVIGLAREAQQRNTSNGRLITERLQHNQAALAILLSAADRPQFYGADGTTRPSAGGRHLGSA